jgi:hypothetical protein
MFEKSRQIKTHGRVLRVEGPNFGSLHRPGGHPPQAQTARPEVKLLKHPLKQLVLPTCLRLNPGRVLRAVCLSPGSVIQIHSLARYRI